MQPQASAAPTPQAPAPAPIAPMTPAPASPPIAPMPQTPAPVPITPGAPGQPAAITPQSPMQLNSAYAHTGLATAALILGIVSLPVAIIPILTLPVPVTGIVLGIVSLGKKKNFALAGIILSVLGIILSGVVLAYGLHVKNSKNPGQTSSNSNNSVVAASGEQISSTCYSLNLPDGLSKSDLLKNEDCITIAVNKTGNDDFAIYSAPLSTPVNSSNLDETLKAQIEAFQTKYAGTLKITSTRFTTVDGQRAYEAVGTENKGNYRFFSYLAVVAPKAYSSVDGLKLQGFTIASDSASSQDVVDKVAKSWHWN